MTEQFVAMSQFVMDSELPLKQALLAEDGVGPLSERIYARVLEGILRGDFGDAGKLPTEGELASGFGVSRPTVREALSRLRSDGVIETRRGSGSHVVTSRVDRGTPMPAIASLADVERYYAFRVWIEAGAAAGAADSRDASDLDEIRSQFDTLGKSMEAGEPGIEADIRFHLAIARASHNPFFTTVIETTVAPIRQFMELARSVTDKKSVDRVRTVQAEHHAIVDAIVRRSAVEAAEAVRMHVINAKRRIFEGTRVP